MSRIVSTISHPSPALTVAGGMTGLIAFVALGLPALAMAAPGALAGWGVYALYHKH